MFQTSITSERLDTLIGIITVTYIIAALADVITTHIGLSKGYTELSFVVNFVWQNWGFFGFLLLKIGLFALVVFIAVPYSIKYDEYRTGKLFFIIIIGTYMITDVVAVLSNISILL